MTPTLLPPKARSRINLLALCLLCTWALTSCAPPLFIHPAQPLILVTLDPNSTATATPFQPGPAADTAIPTSTAPGISVVLTDPPVPTSAPAATDLPPSATFTDAPTTD